MSGRFILSFDCEGKWGVADALNGHHRRALTDDRLLGAYRSILDLLDQYQIEATFAFAGLFTQSPKRFCELRPAIETIGARSPDYLGRALQDIDSANRDGWHGAALVDAVASARISHEIALHGVTHVPWTSMDDEFVAAELGLFEALEGPIRGSRTFVYPRNLVAHVDALGGHGLIGYRSARPQRSRVASLLSEFNLWEEPEMTAAPTGIIPVPAGFFLNCRSGLRQLVPPTVTRERARRLLRRASAMGAVVHYWLHPENLAIAPTTYALLQSLVREVATARERGDCQVLTQLGYCERVRSLA